MLPCRRFADVLADACARLGADVDRYSFIAVDLHHKLLAGLPAHIAVGTPIAGRPPHRSGRARFRHPAPTSGCLTSKRTSGLAVRGPAPGSRAPGSVSGACFADPRSPWSPALAPPAPPPVARLCSSASQLLCRSLTSLDRASAATAPHLPATDHPAPQGLWPIQRSPGSRARSVHTCQGLRPRRVGRALAL